MLASAYRPILQPAEIGLGRRIAVPAARVRAIAHFAGNLEPSLEDVMADPIIHRLMDRDGVAVDTLTSLIAEVRGRLA